MGADVIRHGAGMPRVRCRCRQYRKVLVVAQVLSVQDSPGRGAGDTWSWRRWDFWWGTCTADRVPARSSGAGPTIFFPPAPATASTCSSNRPYLRQ